MRISNTINKATNGLYNQTPFVCWALEYILIFCYKAFGKHMG